MLISEAELVKLLGRPLTSKESANFTLYIDIATETLEDLLCFQIYQYDSSGEDAVFQFQPRAGYSTLWLPAFASVSEVKIKDQIIDTSKYTLQQSGNLNASWFNSIVFDHKLKSDVVSVKARWGFERLPDDLALLLAKLFDLNSKAQSSSGMVASKQIEDFRVTFRTDTTLMNQFMDENSRTIAKYSLCSVGEVRNGNICIRPIRFE